MTQARVGWRAFSSSSSTTSISTLLTSLYGAWNGDTLGTTLDSGIFGAWNGEANNNITVKNAWNANGDATDSKSGANGVVAIPSGTSFTTGSMTYGSGKLGSGSFTFDGTNFINLPNNTLSFTGDFTVSCWFYTPTNYVANGSLVSAFDNKSSYPTYYGWNFAYDSTNKCIGFSVSNPAGGSYANVTLSTPNNSIIPGQWNHVAITRKFNTRSRIYINGVLSASNTSTLNPIYNFGLSYIGAIFYGFQQPHYNKPNAGLKIDSIYTFESELDATAVSELYNSGNGQAYPFTISNALITSPKDSVSTNHGTLVGGMTYTTGKIGQAFQFNGSNSYVSFPTNSWNSLVGTDLTISLWVRFSSTADQTLISNMSSPSINVWSGWEIRLVGGRPTIFMWNNSGTGVGAQGGVISTNTWYHIVATRKKGSRTRIYINGSLAQTDTNTPDPSINGTYYPNIGHLQYSSTYHGLYTTSGTLIDSVNLWPKEISDDEISQLYNSGNGSQYPYSSQTLPSASNQLGIDNGTLMNGTTFTDGKIGKAFTFDGVNDYVQLPNNSMRKTTFSMNFWIFNPVTQSTTLFSDFGNDGQSKGFYLDLNSNSSHTLRFVAFNNSTNIIALNAAGSLGFINRWSMGTLVVDGTSVKLYLDGTLSSSGTMSNTINYVANSYPCIGAFKTNNGTPSGYFNGKIDGLSVWTKALTQAEVTELYNSGTGKQITATPIVTNGLVLNLDASRTSSYPNTGTTWTDISGNSLNGTLTNGVGYTASNGGVMTFDGINDYVSLPDSSILQPSNITISTWFKINQYGTNYVYGNANACLIRKGMYGYEISVRQDGKLIVFAYSDTNNQNQYLIDSINLNTWYNVVLTFGNSQMKVYINNSLVGTYATSTNSIVYGGGGISIGKQGPWDIYYFNGNIGQTMVYNRALTSTEISQNFNATKSRFGL
jgi:hypothetical protein